MTQQSTNTNIRAALGKMTGGDLSESSTQLLAALGYRSDVPAPELPGGAGEFVAAFPATNPNTRTEQDFLHDEESVRLLFQINDRHVAESAPRRLFDAAGFDTGNAQSFLFAAVQLRGEGYPRGQYAALTRELNKRFPMPMVVLFRTATNHITLAFVHRRPNKRDPERDVLGSVSLIREIDAADPHRAHLDILAELSLSKRLEWMDVRGKAHNFDGLLEAWLAALDTEELNRRFYQDLFQWFERAVATARFPTGGAGTLPAEEHVIRLITRLMFVWFIKEKGLVADELFIENRASEILNDYDAASGDSYYRAVLQNLFFATLNTEIGGRRFSRQNNDDHRNFSVYRYRDEIADPDRLLELFGKTPFINGGLFDCLDSFDAAGKGGVRIDCFSDNARHRAGSSIPNWLFFDENRDAPGLITLFNRYKFTVEENTPAEREVALDPELLGKVFENLLAAFNPETRENARKQTGSYYTPRTVVDYMVDEALVATLAQKAAPADGDIEFWQGRLRYLLDYDVAEAETLFDEVERTDVVRAIAEAKVLDPAVGSGAFPMGVLHKLTLALRRLDLHNELWEDLQKEIAGRRATVAFDTPNSEERESELAEISRTFDKYRDSDFGRKLYLIQNGIYGVDIQPIATQIAKLRFFISLAIEQQPNDDAGDNYGIRPLPNLETRFVAADTLLGLESSQGVLTSQRTRELQNELRQNRERYFHANTRALKLRCRDEDKKLRGGLAAELRQIGMAAGDADKIAACDLFDQNATAANWFDAEYMFGVTDGFDIVIGNPPYVSHDKIAQRTKDTLRKNYESHQGFADLYCYFMELASSLTNRGGVSALITSNSYLKADYGAPIRSFLRRNMALLQVLNIEGSQVFDNVIVNVAITLARNTATPTDDLCIVASAPLASGDFRVVIDENSFTTPQSYFERAAWNLVSTEVLNVQRKIQGTGKTLEQLGTKIRLGIATGSNRAFIINETQRRAFCEKSSHNEKLIKPILRGRDIERYQYTLPGLYILLTRNGVDVRRDYPDIYEHLDSFGPNFRNRGAKGKHWTNLRACSFFDDFKKEKIVWIELADTGRFALSDEEVYLLNSAYFLLPPSGINTRFLLGILNSSTICFYLNQIAGTSGMGTSRWINNYVKEFPIPQISKKEQTSLIRLVDRILAAKAADPSADTSEMEDEIDWLVYDLYGLTNEETAVVANCLWDGTLTEEEEDQALLRAMEEADVNERVSLEEVLENLRTPIDG